MRAVAAADVVDELRAIATGDGPSLSEWFCTTRHAANDAGVRGAPLRVSAEGSRSPHVGDSALARSVEGGPRGDPARRVRRRSRRLHALRAVRRRRCAPSTSIPPTAPTSTGSLPTLATVNLMSMFGLHRRFRGALVGHLTLFEMCSVVPMGRYAATLRRLGVPAAAPFYDAHVEADVRHASVALHDIAGALARDEPELAGDIVFGARPRGRRSGFRDFAHRRVVDRSLLTTTVLTYLVPLRTADDDDIEELAHLPPRGRGACRCTRRRRVLRLGHRPSPVRMFGSRVRLVRTEHRTLMGKVGNVMTGLRSRTTTRSWSPTTTCATPARNSATSARRLDAAEGWSSHPELFHARTPWQPSGTPRGCCSHTCHRWRLARHARSACVVRIRNARWNTGRRDVRNLELYVRSAPAGAHEDVALDLLIARRPPTTQHFIRQQVRRRTTSCAAGAASRYRCSSCRCRLRRLRTGAGSASCSPDRPSPPRRKPAGGALPAVGATSGDIVAAGAPVARVAVGVLGGRRWSRTRVVASGIGTRRIRRARSVTSTPPGGRVSPARSNEQGVSDREGLRRRCRHCYTPRRGRLRCAHRRRI